MRALVILRHEKSLGIVREWMGTNGIKADCVALDPVEMPEATEAALREIENSIRGGVDIIILGTKVYDAVKRDKTDPPEQLIDFLQLLKSYGCGDAPLCLTHLADMPQQLIAEIGDTGLNVRWVENDNLGRDGMGNLGPLILSTLQP